MFLFLFPDCVQVYVHNFESTLTCGIRWPAVDKRAMAPLAASLVGATKKIKPNRENKHSHIQNSHSRDVPINKFTVYLLWRKSINVQIRKKKERKQDSISELG